MIRPLTIFLLLHVVQPAFAIAENLAVQEVWQGGADPNDEQDNYAQLGSTLLKQLLSKVDQEKFNVRLWKVELPGKQRYVFLRTPVAKADGSSDVRRLDIVGPAFESSAGKLSEIKIPDFPCKYTNILLPFMELVKDGIQINVHYSVAFTPEGKVTALGNESPSEKNSIQGSARCTLLWKDDLVRKRKEKFICDEKYCSSKNTQILKSLVSKK